MCMYNYAYVKCGRKGPHREKEGENSSMTALHETKEAYLVLADGTVLEGCSFGAEGTSIGEVVFTTGMTGYQETLTDPSYYGQIAVQTFPLIGNYGINDTDEESGKVWMKGYIVREWCDTPSNFRSRRTIEDFLKENGIIGLWGIDTRALTRKIREYGVMNGAVTTELMKNADGSWSFTGSVKDGSYDGGKEQGMSYESLLEEIRAYAITDAVKSVSSKTPAVFKAADSAYGAPAAGGSGENGSCALHVALFDFGYKRNILRSLHSRGCDVTVVPWDTTLADLKEMNVDGVMLSNGPGDPAENTALIANLKEIFEDSDLPVLGICLGHQLAALAMGGRTEKLKYGHRGANQPVLDVENDTVYVTSQNHGYAVVSDSLDPAVCAVSHTNANDGSCEGVIYTRPRTFTVQFHPEASAGPKDTQYLFDRFVANMKAYKEEKSARSGCGLGGGKGGD